MAGDLTHAVYEVARRGQRQHAAYDLIRALAGALELRVDGVNIAGLAVDLHVGEGLGRARDPACFGAAEGEVWRDGAHAKLRDGAAQYLSVGGELFEHPLTADRADDGDEVSLAHLVLDEVGEHLARAHHVL